MYSQNPWKYLITSKMPVMTDKGEARRWKTVSSPAPSPRGSRSSPTTPPVLPLLQVLPHSSHTAAPGLALPCLLPATTLSCAPLPLPLWLHPYSIEGGGTQLQGMAGEELAGSVVWGAAPGCGTGCAERCGMKLCMGGWCWVIAQGVATARGAPTGCTHVAWGVALGCVAGHMGECVTWLHGRGTQPQDMAQAAAPEFGTGCTGWVLVQGCMYGDWCAAAGYGTERGHDAERAHWLQLHGMGSCHGV